MARMIIAGATETSRDQMTRLLASSGYSVYRCCSSGSSLRRALAESEDSILIYLGLFPDCRPEELVWDYGERIQVLWIAKPAVLENCESPDVFRLPIPVKLVEKAKAILMKQLHLTEPEAHHLLQKQAMDHSTKMAEYAARIVEQDKQKK